MEEQFKTPIRLFFVCFLVLIICNKAISQKLPIKFGEIDSKDVEMKSYDKDPEAEAVILCAYGESKVEGIGDKYRVIYNRHFRIKILKTEGFNYGTVHLYNDKYGSRRETITNLKGYTYNYENGIIQKTKLEKENIFEKEMNENIDQISFAMQNIKIGSVIEYSYTQLSEFIFALDPWYFQNSIPILWSECRVSVSDELKYVQVGNSILPYNSKEENFGIYRWTMKDVPAFRNEKYITNPRDYYNVIDFQLAGQGQREIIGDYKQFTNDLLKEEKYGNYLNKKGSIRDIVSTLIEGKTTAIDKMNAIYQYVSVNFQYNNEDDHGVDPTQMPRQLIKSKTGNSKEINLLLVMMLKEADLEAYPVILSTRSHGLPVVNYPIYNKFNYTIAYIKIGGEYHLLDATDPMRPVDMISYEALNKEGLVLIPDGKQFWVPLQNQTVSKSSTTIIGGLNITSDGQIKGNITSRYSGYEALRLRKKVIKSGITDDVNEKTDDEVKNMTFKNINEYSKPLENEMKYESNEFTQINGDLIYVTPLLKYQTKENPFKQPDRKFPVDFAHTIEENYFLTFTIPDGYIVEELPKSNRYQWDDKSVKYDFLIQVQENRIQIISKLNINKAIFKPEEYQHLRDMYSKIVAKHQEQIVLKKK